MSQDRDLVIGWIAPATCSTLFAVSLTSALLDDRVRARLCRVVSVISGPLLSPSRTKVTDLFLQTDAQWLLMVDSDQVFTPADILALLKAADAEHRPIVGGLYTGSGQGLETTQAPEGDYGAGFLLVHRRVFEHLAALHPRPLPWFQECVRDGEFYGEDTEFFQRAIDAGFRIHLHSGVRIGHVKAVVLRPEPKEDKP